MDYSNNIVLSSKYISDSNLLKTISNNILFVDKYVDLVEERFKDNEEKAIVYRQLGSIVYSCIEATLKSILVEINYHCNNRNCKDHDCKYRAFKDNDAISLGSTLTVFLHLLSTRLIGFSTYDIDRFKRLSDLRNYIHISKNINNEAKEVIFDKEYVYSLLDYYYEIVYQINSADYYFGDDALCLKEIDENGFDLTKKQTHKEMSILYLLKLYPILHKMFRNEKLSSDDGWIIKAINDKKVVDHKEVASFICGEISYYRRRFKSKEEYIVFVTAFKRSLLKLIYNKQLIELINKRLNVNDLLNIHTC